MTARAPHADEVLTSKEVAEWLKMTPRQVLRLKVPCVDLGRKTKRYLSADVRAWLEGHRALVA